MKAIVGLFLIVCMVGCEGKEGPMGQDGAQGEQGEIGDTGLHMWPVLIMSVKYLLGRKEMWDLGELRRGG